jgi:aminoglycoside phosphotransferase (APT) family kinase protein
MAFSNRQIAAYFSERLSTAVAIREMKQTFPGISRETWLIDAEVCGTPQGFVLRVDPPEGSSFPFPLSQEWGVYDRLYESEIPVAEPLWFDADLDFAEGRAHMVRRLVDGSTSIEGLTDPTSAGRELRRLIAFECVDKLALLHTLDWQALGFADLLPVPPSPAESFRRDFALWRGIWDDSNPAPDPVIEEALCWMQENIPADTPRISLTKGNNGLGEEIFRDNRIVAMSDWEGAALGDGLTDLFWSQGTLQLADFDEIIARYEERVGSKVSIERMAFAKLLIFFKAIVCLQSCLYRNYKEGRTKRIYGPSFLYSFVADVEHRLAQCIGKNLIDAWRIIGKGEKSLYAQLEAKT